MTKRLAARVDPLRDLGRNRRRPTQCLRQWRLAPAAPTSWPNQGQRARATLRPRSLGPAAAACSQDCRPLCFGERIASCWPFSFQTP